MKWTKVDIMNCADEAGIYIFMLNRGSRPLEPFYVGESLRINSRLHQHRKGMKKGKRAFLRPPTFDSKLTWLGTVIEQRNKFPWKEHHYVYPAQGMRPDNLNTEAASFWDRLEFYTITGDFTDHSFRLGVETSLQNTFTRWLLSGDAEIPSQRLAMDEIPVGQGTRSLFLGKRGGICLPNLSLGAIPQTLQHMFPAHMCAGRNAA